MQSLELILCESAKRHRHLCPRQVLGARMGILAGEILKLDLPRADKKVLVIAETDGCTVDGLIAATGCHVGGRTLRILDFGKIAATFIDTCTAEAIRIAPGLAARSLAVDYAPGSRNRWESMLLGYQAMPADELFVVQHVHLDTPLSQIVSRPGRKATCEMCGEEIINGREILSDHVVLCRACAGGSYYHAAVSGQMSREETLLSSPVDSRTTQI